MQVCEAGDSHEGAVCQKHPYEDQPIRLHVSNKTNEQN